MGNDKAQRIVIMSGALVIFIGTVNSIYQDKRWPAARFWIGAGVAFVGLSWLAEIQPDIAAPFSIAILTTVAIGEGNGVLSFISRREIDTHKRPPKDDDGTVIERREARPGVAMAPLGTVPVRPVPTKETPLDPLLYA